MDFITATITALASLFFLAPGIVGVFRGKLHVVERAILIVAACALVLYPIDFRSPWGLIPFGVGALVLVRNYLAFRPAPPLATA